MENEILSFFEGINIRVKRKKREIPVKYRSRYRMMQILMILKINGRNSTTASLKKINLLIYALDDKEERKNIEALKNREFVKNLIFKYDPTVNRAIMLLYSEQLILINDKGKFELTTKGNEYISKILNEKIFREESRFLRKIGKGIAEKNIEDIFKESKND